MANLSGSISASRLAGGSASKAAGGATRGSGDGVGSYGIFTGLDAGFSSGLPTDRSVNISANRFVSHRIASIWTDKPIILTIILAYVSRLEKQSMQSGSSSFCISSTDIIQMATFASCCLQGIEKLRLRSPLSGQVCNAKLFKAFSYVRVWSAVVRKPLVKFVASNLWCLLKNRRLEYFIVRTYIIPSFAIILYASKSRTWPIFIWLYIQLSQ